MVGFGNESFTIKSWSSKVNGIDEGNSRQESSKGLSKSAMFGNKESCEDSFTIGFTGKRDKASALVFILPFCERCHNETLQV